MRRLRESFLFLTTPWKINSFIYKEAKIKTEKGTYPRLQFLGLGCGSYPGLTPKHEFFLCIRCFQLNDSYGESLAKGLAHNKCSVNVSRNWSILFFRGSGSSVQLLNRVTPWTATPQASHHQLLELAQTHVHWIDDAIQPSPPAFNPSQHQCLF